MRDVNGGWALRYVHANGASLFFFAVYCHIFRGIYYGSYKAPREITWIIGMLIYLLMMATAFMGYVLPWGQMSFWGATVITGLFRRDPADRTGHPDLAARRAGGRQSDAEPLLQPALPAAVRDRRPRDRPYLGVPHHRQQQPDRRRGAPRARRRRSTKDTLPFWPYFVIKDLFALVFVLVIFAAIVGFMPNFLGHPDNYVEANPLKTPAHIVPEWYFLPFYAMLRAITFDILFINSKLAGVLTMFGSIAVLLLLPWLDTSRVRSGRYRPMFKVWFWLLVVDFVLLMWCGSQPPEQPFVIISQLATLYWFAFFLVILPLLGVIEKPLPPPETIEADFLRALRRRRGTAWRAPHQQAGRMSPSEDRHVRRRIISRRRRARCRLGAGPAAPSEHEEAHVTDFSFSFEGPFGRFDQAQLQRGLQVYTEVCSACHGLKFVTYRELAEPGGPSLTDEQMRAYAAMHDVTDAETGEDRPATPSDHFQHSPTRQCARPQPDGQGARGVRRAGRAGDQPAHPRHRRAGVYRLDPAPASPARRRTEAGRHASTRTRSSPAAGSRCRRRSPRRPGHLCRRHPGDHAADGARTWPPS